MSLFLWETSILSQEVRVSSCESCWSSNFWINYERSPISLQLAQSSSYFNKQFKLIQNILVMWQGQQKSEVKKKVCVKLKLSVPKKNARWLKIFSYKVFVHWKLKWPNFQMDSVLNKQALVLKFSFVTSTAVQLKFLVWKWPWLNLVVLEKPLILKSWPFPQCKKC